MSHYQIGDMWTSDMRAINVANYVLGVETVVMKSGTLSKILIGTGTTAGTVTNIGRLKIVSSDGGGPTSTVLHDTMVFTPVGGYSPYEITLTTPFSVTKGQRIYLLFSNADPSPATNYYQIGTIAPSFGKHAESAVVSYDNGLTFTTAATCCTTLINLYISGNYAGTPILRVNNNPNSSPIYSTSTVVRRVGTVITTHIPLTINSAVVPVTRTGTLPNSRLQIELYSGATLLGNSLPSTAKASDVTTNYYGWSLMECIMQPVALEPGLEYYLVARLDITEGDASNYLAIKCGSYQTSANVIPNAYNKTHYLGKVESSAMSVTNPNDWTTVYTKDTYAFIPLMCIKAKPSGGGLLVNTGFNGGLIQI